MSSDDQACEDRTQETLLHHNSEKGTGVGALGAQNAKRVQSCLEMVDGTLAGDCMGFAPVFNRSMLSMLGQEGEPGPAKGTPNTVTAEHENSSGMGSINASMSLKQPALDVSLAKDTKMQKSSLLRYREMFCAAFRIEMHQFGA